MVCRGVSALKLRATFLYPDPWPKKLLLDKGTEGQMTPNMKIV